MMYNVNLLQSLELSFHLYITTHIIIYLDYCDYKTVNKQKKDYLDGNIFEN